MMPRKGRDTDADPCVQSPFTEIRPPRPHGNGRADRIVAGVCSPFALAPQNQRAEVDITHLICFHPVPDRPFGINTRPHHLHASDMRRMKQALDMFLEAENGWPVRCIIAPNALKDTEPIVQRMTEHMDLGLVPIYKLSIHPNLLRGLHGALLPPRTHVP